MLPEGRKRNLNPCARRKPPTHLASLLSRRETSNPDEAATDKAERPAGGRQAGTRDPSGREVLAPECRAGGRWARGGRGGAAGRTARRWPAPSTSRRTRRAEESARAAARTPARPPPRHLFGRAPVPLSRPAAGSRAPGPAALGRLRPPYLTSAAARSRPSRRRGGGRRDPRPSLPRPAAARARAASQGRPRPPRSSPRGGGGGRGGPGARSRRSLPPFAPPLPPRGLTAARPRRSHHPGVCEG